MRKQGGFTIIELMLAMAFFSFIMLLVVTGFVQINRSYTRGLTVKEVQKASRSVVEELSRSIRGAAASDIVIQDGTMGNNLRLCVGTTRYGWNMVDSGGTLTSETYGDNTEHLSIARTTTGTGCDDPIDRSPGTSDTTVSLLSDILGIQHLNVSRIGTTNSFKITLVVSTDVRGNPGDFDVLGLDAACDIGTGDQFCDVARVDTVVTSRN